MIPGVIQEFLTKATVGVAGTRDAELIPQLHKLSGWRLEDDNAIMRCLIASEFTESLVRNIADNGRLTVAIEEIGPHETYQFKGTVVDTDPVGDEDLGVYETIRLRFGDVVSAQFGLPVDDCRAYYRRPAIAVRLRVEEIFLQTPGPGAGRRLIPQEDAP